MLTELPSLHRLQFKIRRRVCSQPSARGWRLPNGLLSFDAANFKRTGAVMAVGYILHQRANQVGGKGVHHDFLAHHGQSLATQHFQSARDLDVAETRLVGRNHIRRGSRSQ